MQGLLMIDMQKAFDNSSWGERNNPQLEVNSQKLLNFFNYILNMMNLARSLDNLVLLDLHQELQS